MEELSDYYNLISNSLDDLSIEKKNNFECKLVDNNGNTYKGFILAKSEKGKAYTLCEISFQKSNTDNKYKPRLIFRRTNAELNDKSVYRGQRHQRISFLSGQDGYRRFWEMIAFLYKIRKQINLEQFFNKHAVIDSEVYIVKFRTKQEADQLEDLKKILVEADLDEDQIKEILQVSRRKTLKSFRKLLEKNDWWKKYYKKYESVIAREGEEAVWHHFLKKHDWILGLNADIRFIRDLISEVEVSNSTTAGTGAPKADILGISDYTVLVELKKPSTRIFTSKKSSKARANTWSFSSDLIEGVSQCLGQKFDWDKQHNNKLLKNIDGKIIDQEFKRTVDPKGILIIGNKSKEFPDISRKSDVITKRDTFERFRRNNRNIQIVTFDELFKRAYFIVYGEEPDSLVYKSETELNLDKIPF